MTPLKLFLTLYDGVELLPHFLAHYTRLGVGQFILGVGVSPSGDYVEAVRHHCAGYDAYVYPFTVANLAIADKDGMQAMIRQRHPVGPDEYWVPADLDEFQQYPAPLAEIIQQCDRQNIWAIQSRFLDRVAIDGHLPPVTPEPDLGSQFPLGCQFTERVVRGEPRKVILCRGRARLRTSGHHDTAVGMLDRWPIGQWHDYRVHHFKWNASTIARLRERIQRKALGFVYWEESARALRHLGEEGRVKVEDPSLGTIYCGRLRYCG